jgi:hypothetical protein
MEARSLFRRVDRAAKMGTAEQMAKVRGVEGIVPGHSAADRLPRTPAEW